MQNSTKLTFDTFVIFIYKEYSTLFILSLESKDLLPDGTVLTRLSSNKYHLVLRAYFIDTEGIVLILAMARNQFCFAIDRGGTFTDVYALCPGSKVGQFFW